MSRRVREPIFLFAGGGTGGHLFPGLAVAAELREREPGARAVFVGSGREIEAGIVAAAGCEHHVLPVEPSTALRRNPLRFAWRMWRAYREGAAILRELRPAAVIGLGGFASVPVVVAAGRLGIPTVLLEQNTVPGRATRWLSRRASLVCLSFDETRRRLPPRARTTLTGNPVRREIAALHARSQEKLSENGDRHPSSLGGKSPEPQQPGASPRFRTAYESEPADRPTLLVLGGSQGAQAINEAMLRLAGTITERLSGWRIVHQTGQAQAGQVRREYAERGPAAVVEPFFNDLSDWYRRADAVVARAGATTLAELACAGCPAVLVPYPNSIGDHQLWNARAYVSAGAARLVEQRGDAAATAQALAEQLRPLLGDAAVRERMRQAMRRLARPQAAEAVAGQIIERALR